ncbi:MAG: cell division protein FtsZ, partial [Rhodospirillaceae bacterium]|nr:cell division protein FtsZ [Rhodospirillaceae bacterium]
DQLMEHMQAAHMVFITAGMGGGTGTGAAPVIARAAREMGVLTVGVVTRPFHFEGAHRMRIAEQGIEELTQYVDTLIIIPNQNLFRVANEKTTFADAFAMADDVLHSGVRGVTDLMVMPGLINLDFADIRTVMSEMGKAMMGTGEAEGEKRALDAAEAAISNPLLEDISMKGAHGILINITGGLDMTLFEVDEAANRIRDEVDPEANIIFGSTFDEAMEGKMRVSVVATGIDVAEAGMPRPAPLSLVSDRTARRQTQEPVEASEVQEVTARIDRMAEQGSNNAGAATAVMPAARPAATAAPSAHAVARAIREEVEERAIEPAAEATPVEKERESGFPGLGALLGRGEAARKTTGEEPFIAPRPVEPPRQAEEASQPADPFAEAAMTNASGEQLRPKKRGQSLFARVTGASRTRDAEPASTPTAAQPATRTAEERPVERPATPPVPGPAKVERADQQRLGGLDPEERIRTSQADGDDLLEIPAFLRRQAN